MCTSRSIRDSAAARALCAAAGVCCVATSAGAHGFGERYDLPLPLSFYLVGTAAAIVFSFVIVGLFVRRDSTDRGYRHVDLLARPAGRWITHPGLVLSLKLVALGLFVVTIAAGFWGDQNPYRNIAPTLVWVIGWVGLAYVSAFAGNLWALINPWRSGFDAAAWAYRRTTRRALARHASYPARLGVWPAFFLLLAFSWIELVYPGSASPARIAWFALAYSLLTWAGMFVFGSETWLRHGEVFTLVFGTFARFAPTEVRVRDPSVCERCEIHCRNPDGDCIDCYECFRRADAQHRVWALRPFGAGLLDSRPATPSMTAFVLLLLSTVLFDGALGTSGWRELERHAAAFAPGFGDAAPIAIRTLGLVAFWMVFFGAYASVSMVMSVVAAEHRSPRDMAQNFAFTLVPIAIAYHLAHYLSFLLLQGQYVVPLLSDPFGRGWNLFGTAGYRVDIGMVGAAFAWYSAVTAVVCGHIAAVYLAHVKAMRALGTRRTAMRSQIPLIALMVVYTFVSLSILAEPITERRATAQPAATDETSIPADALLPVAGTGVLQPVGSGRHATLKLTYRIFGSAFHDGTRMTVADFLYGYMFAYRWGVRTEAQASHYDPFVDTATAPLREHLAGVRVVGVDATSKSFSVGDVNFVRELFVMEVYATMTSQGAEEDAAVVPPPWSTVPWHLIVLMEEAVSRGWAAFSSTEARRRGIEWLDLVRSDPMNRRLALLVEMFERDGYRPEALRSLVSVDEARKRWAALAAFYKTRGHFLATNGPYQLKRWSADEVGLDVFRDLSYPLGVGSYDTYAIPRRGYVTRVERADHRIRLFGDVETIMKFQRSYDIVREPLQSLAPDVLKRAAPECRYVVVDDQKRVVQAGLAALTGDSTFQVDLDRKLAAGRYTMLAEIAVNGNAMNADIRRIDVPIASDR